MPTYLTLNPVPAKYKCIPSSKSSAFTTFWFSHLYSKLYVVILASAYFPSPWRSDSFPCFSFPQMKAADFQFELVCIRCLFSFIFFLFRYLILKNYLLAEPPPHPPQPHRWFFCGFLSICCLRDMLNPLGIHPVFRCPEPFYSLLSFPLLVNGKDWEECTVAFFSLKSPTFLEYLSA